MRNKQNLVWEKKDLIEKEVKDKTKSQKRACLKSLRGQFPRLNSTVCRIYFKKEVSVIWMFG